MNRFSLIPWRRERSALASPTATPYMSLKEEFDRFFESFFNEWPATSVGESSGAFNPAVNIAEDETSLQVTAELPGLNPEEIHVSVSGDQLIIEGEKKVEHEEKEANYHRVERRYGTFRRVLPLPPDSVDRDKVEADYRDGVLTVTLPKSPEATRLSRRISVKSS